MIFNGSRCFAVACGESPLGYTPGPLRDRLAAAVACGESPLGYTLTLVDEIADCAVACGESPLGYTEVIRVFQRDSLWLVGNRRSDTLETGGPVDSRCCGLWGIAARIHWPLAIRITVSAVACGESPLGYTCLHAKRLRVDAVACGESPLGYTSGVGCGCGRGAVACGESPLGYTLSELRLQPHELWLVGNRRSDTL